MLIIQTYKQAIKMSEAYQSGVADYTDDEIYEDLLKHFNDNGKKEIKKIYEDNEKEKELNEKTHAGRVKIKNELKRIKETAPHKCLKMMMDLTIKMDELRTIIDQNVEGIAKIDEIENVIANADNENNLFNTFTELMSVCNESEITKKVLIQKNEKKMKNLTEAQKISYANDPLNTEYMMCPDCMRVMTCKHYKSNHKGTMICVKITNVKMATLHSGHMSSNSQKETLIKITARTPTEFNEVSNKVDWGDGKKILIKDK